MTSTTTDSTTPRIKHLPPSPHGDFEEVFDRVWFIRGEIKMPMLMPMKIGRSMTVVGNGSGELTIFNSMRLTESGLQALEKLGSVAHVVRLAGFHGRDDAFYRERYGAKVYAIEGQQYTRGIGGTAKTEQFMQPDVWLNAESQLPIADATLWVCASSDPPEGAALLQREGGIFISGDTLQHTPAADEFFNFPAKLMMKKMGFLKPHNVGPGWLQFAKPRASDVRTLMDLTFEHVLPGHGKPVIGAAKEKFRASIEGDLKGCHQD